MPPKYGIFNKKIRKFPQTFPHCGERSAFPHWGKGYPLPSPHLTLLGACGTSTPPILKSWIRATACHLDQNQKGRKQIDLNRGVATGGISGIYTLPKLVQVKFFTGQQ